MKAGDFVGLGVLSVLGGIVAIPVVFFAFVVYGPLIDSHGSCHLWLRDVHVDELPGTVLSIYSDEEHCTDVILSATEASEGHLYRPFTARKGRSQLRVVCGGKVVAEQSMFVKSDDNYISVRRVPDRPAEEASEDGQSAPE